MADQQPKALRLAEWLQSGADDPMWSDHTEMPKSVAAHAAAELRRLHSVNAQLLEALEEALRIEPVIAGSVVNAYPEHKLAVTRCLDKARAAIEAAHGITGEKE